jgi:hypothetical protein
MVAVVVVAASRDAVLSRSVGDAAAEGLTMVIGAGPCTNFQSPHPLHYVWQSLLHIEHIYKSVSVFGSKVVSTTYKGPGVTS